MIRTWTKFAQSGALALSIPDSPVDRRVLTDAVVLVALLTALETCVQVGHLPAPVVNR